MSMQRVCDKCGEIIDQTKPFWSVSAVQQQSMAEQEAMLLSGGGATMPPMTGNTSVQADFHEEHLPEELRPEPVEEEVE